MPKLGTVCPPATQRAPAAHSSKVRQGDPAGTSPTNGSAQVVNIPIGSGIGRPGVAQAPVRKSCTHASASVGSSDSRFSAADARASTKKVPSVRLVARRQSASVR